MKDEAGIPEDVLRLHPSSLILHPSKEWYNERIMLLVTLVLSLLATLGVGFYIVLSAPHISTHRAFAFFLGTMTFWIVKDIVLWGLHGPNDPASWWAILSFLISLALNVSFLYFAWIFPEEAKVSPRKTL